MSHSLAIALVISFSVLVLAKPPHILHILIDDFGWANVGYHRKDDPTKEVQTPVIDQLVKDGIELDRHYVFKYCSPTRSAILSGRNPIHVNVLNLSFDYYNPFDPISGFAGIPRNMTVIGEKMKMGGYATHMVGKWDVGMATPDHIPKGRGFDTSLIYFNHENDYWTGFADDNPCGPWNIVDLWEDDHPATTRINNATCSQSNQVGCVYEDTLFTNQVLDIIQSHDPDVPLFIYWAPHTIHAPLQVPQDILDKFSFIDHPARRFYQAMTYFMDSSIGQVVDALKQKGLWDNTLVSFMSDNGGPIYNNGTSGGNNYPLKGGKASNWEGGIRVNAFVSGGFIPQKRRGTVESGYITGWDWYGTYCSLAGVNPEDEKAKLAGLPPVDSYDMWPLLSGQTNKSLRNEIILGDTFLELFESTVIGGLIQGPWKLILGLQTQTGWTGPTYPNSSTNWQSDFALESCEFSGCLFNIETDPTEHNEVGDQFPEIRHKLHERIRELEKTVFSPDRGLEDPAACGTALTTWGGFWGPWLN